MAGCAGPADDAPGRVAPPGQEQRLEASLSQPRPDEGTDLLRVAVVNHGRVSVRVGGASVAWPGFEATPVRLGERLEPGRAAAFTLRHGAPRCDRPTAAPPRLAVQVDGRERLLVLEPTDAAVVRLLHERACRQERLRRTAHVGLRLSDRLRGRGADQHVPGHVVVRLRPGADGSLTVVGLAGSVLLGLDAHPGLLPVTASPARPHLRVPVRVTATRRCDAHALTNSSQTFLLAVHVRLGQEPAERVVRFPGAAARRTLTRLLDRACAG